MSDRPANHAGQTGVCFHVYQTELKVRNLGIRHERAGEDYQHSPLSHFGLVQLLEPGAFNTQCRRLGLRSSRQKSFLYQMLTSERTATAQVDREGYRTQITISARYNFAHDRVCWPDLLSSKRHHLYLVR
jgi:hypothetical protein